MASLEKKTYSKPEIVYNQKIEARAVACAKNIGDNACESQSVNS